MMPVVSLPEKIRSGSARKGVFVPTAGEARALPAQPRQERGLSGRSDRKASLIAGLRRRIEALECPPPRAGLAAPLALGLPAVDQALPGGGLRPAALHEIQGTGAAIAFTAALAARRLHQDAMGPVLWCRTGIGLYPPGLSIFGLAADDLILVRGDSQRDVLWAMEEGLISGKPAIVVGEVGRLDLTASRRLQLAAETGGLVAVLLASGREVGRVSAASTRWRLKSAPSAPTPGYRGIGQTRFSAELLRCRGGAPGAWLLEWNDATHTFTLAAALGDGPALPRVQAAQA